MLDILIMDSKLIPANRKNTNKAVRTIVKACGDLITSSNGWGLWRMLGVPVSNFHIGLGGFVSSSVHSWEVFDTCK